MLKYCCLFINCRVFEALLLQEGSVLQRPYVVVDQVVKVSRSCEYIQLYHCCTHSCVLRCIFYSHVNSNLSSDHLKPIRVVLHRFIRCFRIWNWDSFVSFVCTAHILLVTAIFLLVLLFKLTLASSVYFTFLAPFIWAQALRMTIFRYCTSPCIWLLFPFCLRLKQI